MTQSIEHCCPHAELDETGTGFRCGIADRAYSNELCVLDIEKVTNPIVLHLKGVRDTTRCLYRDGRLQQRCFGSMVSPEGLDWWIYYATVGERQIIFRGNEEKCVNVFGPDGQQRVRVLLDRDPYEPEL